jgi:zinc transporter, ZIP family
MDAETLGWIVASGLCTAIGGLFLLVIRRPTARLLDALLGFTAGVMLAATAFSLLVPALERGSVGEVLVGFLLGAVTLLALDRFVPHAHERMAERGMRPPEAADPRHRAALLLSALTIHNFPEGMAVGLAFAAGGPDLGIPLAIAIGIQNVPEGFAAAAPLLATGTSPRVAAAIAALTGVVEPPAAIAAFGLSTVGGAALVPGLGFAAGAMLYVIADELIPESHSGGNEQEATLALLLGFALMMGLDTAFG